MPNAKAKFVSKSRQNYQNGAGSNQLKEVGRGWVLLCTGDQHYIP